MVEHKFDNKYDVILITLSLLLDRFEEEDQQFAAQCIWWLANIIPFTDIVIFYRHHTVFLSEVIKDCVVTTLLQRVCSQALVLESDIPALDMDQDTISSEANLDISSDIKVHSS